jgi:hypothetical protein
LFWIWKIHVVIIGIYNVTWGYVVLLHFDIQYICNKVWGSVTFIFSLNFITKHKALIVWNSWIRFFGDEMYVQHRIAGLKNIRACFERDSAAIRLSTQFVAAHFGRDIFGQAL